MKVPRIAGIDLVYAISVCVVICFSLSVGLTGRESTLSVVSFDLIADAFAALFLFLNGIMASLMMCRGNTSKRKVRAYIIRKGLFFIAIGVLASFFWPIQILITLGCLFLIAPVLTQFASSIIRALYVIGVVAVILLFSFGDVRGVGEVPAFAISSNFIADYFCYVVVSGYFSLLPWSIFFIAGLLFGRLDFLHPKIKRIASFCSWIGVGVGSIIQIFGGTLFSSASSDKSELIFPFFKSPEFNIISFILISTGLSIILINFCLTLGEKKTWVKILLQRMGSFKHTLYINHLIYGLVLLLIFGQKGLHSVSTLVAIIGFYLGVSIVFTWIWKKQFTLGPVEWVLKMLSRSNEKT